MARSRMKSKGRRESGRFVALPIAVLESHAWQHCGPWACKLTVALAAQFTGRNNGNLCAALTIMKTAGFSSSQTLARALAEVEHFGLVVRTRQGGRNCPSLYALSWLAIDEGPHDATPTRTPPGNWKVAVEPFVHKPRAKSGRWKNASTCSVTELGTFRNGTYRPLKPSP